MSRNAPLAYRVRMAETTPATFRQTLRVLVATLLGSEVVLLLAVTATTSPSGGFNAPPVWAILVVVGLGVVSAIATDRLGYRLPAIEPGAEPDETRARVLRAVQSTTLVRFVISEVGAFGSFALAFNVSDGGAIVCLIGVLLSLAIGIWNVWPGARVLTRVRSTLEREGGTSYLDDVLDAPPSPRPR